MKEISFFFLLSVCIACATNPAKPDPYRDPLVLRQEKIRQCYLESDSYVKGVVKPKGQMEIAYTINPEGKVSQVKILKTDFKDANFSACVEYVVKQTKFGKSKNGKSVDIIQPLDFWPKENS